MASRDKADVDTFHKCIQYALEKLGKSKSGFERTVLSKFKSKRRVGSGNELVDYSRAPCLGADQKARGLWERDCRLPGAPGGLWGMLSLSGFKSKVMFNLWLPLAPRSEIKSDFHSNFEDVILENVY